MRPLIRVVTSTESAARDASAIAAGVPSRALMQRAGAAAASEIALRYRDQLHNGVLVLAGPGNNGGDAWVVARALATVGVRVRVIEPVSAKTTDAIAEKALALAVIPASSAICGAVPHDFDGGERIVVDGLLGTGGSGSPRGEIADAIERANRMRARGAITVAIDVASGLDATSGAAADPLLAADLTLTFATAKRGHLVNRQASGRVVVVDIGLDAHAALDDGAPTLVDEAWVAAQVPPIPPNAHKGTRKKLAIVGGAKGMAGATVLAARAALRSGIGMVKIVAASDSVPVIQESEPAALAAAWPADDDAFDRDVSAWADCLVIGPGLGRSDASRELLDRALRRWTGPTVLDADALTLFEHRVSELALLLADRPALITPHPAEFGRLSGQSVDDVLATRFDAGAPLARQIGAAVLLKGTPTVVSAPDGRRLVSASGTAALATAGSGDLLSGIAGTLLAQLQDPATAGAVAAWVHGRSAERIPSTFGGGVRGASLDDVVAELRDSWGFDRRPGRYPVLAELIELGVQP
jgi:ADP-dependent NAD(P)H-hydrate dehydratase / NAD(P)H-hydrate epimerase